MTTATPLSYTFVSWNIQEHKDHGFLGKLPGLAAGLAIGGPMGEMVFGGTLLSKSSYSCSGELGLLVLTEDNIHLAHFTAPLQSKVSKIVPDHLAIFQSLLASNNITRKTFNIRQSQISLSPEAPSFVVLACGMQKLSFQKADLYVNETIYELPNVAELQKQIAQLGTLITPDEFIAKLLRHENPITDAQLDQIQNDDTYFRQLFTAILKHRQRNTIITSFSSLSTIARRFLTARIEEEASAYKPTLVKCVIYAITAAFGIIGIDITTAGVFRPQAGAFENGIFGSSAGAVVGLLCLVTTITTLVLSVRAYIRLKRAMWYRNWVRPHY